MSKWDEKAKTYTRYTEGNDRFEAKILQALKQQNIEIKNKTILDIGCGTGVYTLRIAQLASHVDAIDSSAEMLKVLEQDAQTHHIKNITTFHQSWDTFTLPKELYDLAICTMSPAIDNSKNFAKMTQCAQTKIYLGWAGLRSSTILEALFQAHNVTYTHPNGAGRLSSWLEQNAIPYKILSFDEYRETKKDFDTAMQSFRWHLEVRGVTPDSRKMKTVLETYRDQNNNVTEQMNNRMSLILW